MLRLLGILALGNMISGNRRRDDGLLGGLLLLPALMAGGWVMIAVLGGILGLVGSVIGGVFEGLAGLAEGIFSGSGLLLGIVIGLVLYFWMKKKNAARTDQE